MISARSAFHAIGGVALALAVAGCAAAQPTAADAPQPADDWVIVSYDETAETFDLGIMDALLETEIAADEALRSVGAGWIDGNEIGNHQYDLYFTGGEREAMWAILEPVFADAPIAWTSVELRSGFDDVEPIILTPSSPAP